ncbi:MAG: SDR family oxidoreductase [Calditrichia bacterium]
MKKVFITGSSGFLGRYLLKYAPPQGYRLLAHYRSKKPNSYGKDVVYIPIDFLEDHWISLKELRPNVIIHTAAMASIDECEVKPQISHHINFEAVRQLSDLANEWKARFILISSDVVFDGEKGNYSESDPPAPLNVYARSKVQAESYVLENNPEAVVVRPGLFYGLALNGRPSFTETMLESLHAGKQVFLFTDQIRTPILINNLAEALWELVESDFCGVLHLGGAQRCNRLEMGEILCEMFNLDPNLLIPVTSVQANLIARRPLDCSLDTSLSHRILKTPFVDCRTGFSIAYR